ncbi:MAG: histidine phosphatase family protein [Oscillospiraceae bacterium]|nr:histidine phosphatase family protein [Oscillospiraceae bacterium]
MYIPSPENVLLDLTLVRHGQSYGNVPPNNRLAHADAPNDWHLTPLGVQQADYLGRYYAALPLDQVICSHLQRAQQTAQAVVKHQPKPVALRVDPEVCEVFDCGSSDPAQWQARALRVVRALREDSPLGARVMVVAHGVFNNFLLNALLGLPAPPHTVRFFQQNTSVSRVIFCNENVPEYERIQLQYMNRVNHLPQELIT